jgi:nicotinamide mononucleotide transporter
MNWSNFSWIELVSSVSGLAGVWLNTRLSAWGWPLGIFSVALAAVVYFESRLFAEFGLQVFYAASGFYGWIMWKKKPNDIQQGISLIKPKPMMANIFWGLSFGVCLGWYLQRFTMADFPYPDSLITGFSLVAQIWLARKYLENWILWILINVASVFLYLQKGLLFFSVFYLILLFLALKGFFDWKKKLQVYSD